LPVVHEHLALLAAFGFPLRQILRSEFLNVRLRREQSGIVCGKAGAVTNDIAGAEAWSW
jgi:hypothetical protein